MKYTLLLTQRCNLACDYCYVGKSTERMTADLALRVVNFAFRNTPLSEDIDIGFFGGEPLLEFPLIQSVMEMIEQHPAFDPCRVKLGIVTNGTLLSFEIARYLKQHNVALNISCDGRPEVHDKFRHFPNGKGSSGLVEHGIRTALEVYGRVPVNAVYRPETFHQLPETIDYFSSLGVRQIYLNPDFSARWSRKDADDLPLIYGLIADRYMDFYRSAHPHFISLLDSKIALVLRGGYHPAERCRMGEGEFAFAPSGHIYPCERLASCDPEQHSIGNSNRLIQIHALQDHTAPGTAGDTPCSSCAIRDYCMNWCGCSNYFMTGFYNRVGAFHCASERALIDLSLKILKTLESELGPTFFEHVAGRGLAPSAGVAQNEAGATQRRNGSPSQ